MAKRRPTTERIIGKLGEAQGLVAQGMTGGTGEQAHWIDGPNRLQVA